MSCHEITERLDAWIDGELEGTEAASVEQHLSSCADCAALVAERQALSLVLQDSLAVPAEIAAEEGRFDGLWDRVAAGIGESVAVTEAETAAVPNSAPVLQPQPTPAPSLWQRLAAWWGERFEQRQAWMPALAAAAALVVMVALLADRVGEQDGAPASPDGARLEVAASPTAELPPFAEPRIAAREGDNGRRLAQGTPAPRRRGAEDMVARANEASVVAYEVDRGIVLIEQPEEMDQPMVVWHLMPEDVEGVQGDGDII